MWKKEYDLAVTAARKEDELGLEARRRDKQVKWDEEF